jgi:hypothetical protein
MNACIKRLNEYLLGWIGFFWICTNGAEQAMQALDAHIRRRLRAIQLEHWKTKSTIARKLTQLGLARKTAWQRVYEGRRSRWALSHHPAVERTLRNAYFANRGLVSIVLKWRELLERIVVPRDD